MHTTELFSTVFAWFDAETKWMERGRYNGYVAVPHNRVGRLNNDASRMEYRKRRVVAGINIFFLSVCICSQTSITFLFQNTSNGRRHGFSRRTKSRRPEDTKKTGEWRSPIIISLIYTYFTNNSTFNVETFKPIKFLMTMCRNSKSWSACTRAPIDRTMPCHIHFSCMHITFLLAIIIILISAIQTNNPKIIRRFTLHCTFKCITMHTHLHVEKRSYSLPQYIFLRWNLNCIRVSSKKVRVSLIIIYAHSYN